MTRRRDENSPESRHADRCAPLPSLRQLVPLGDLPPRRGDHLVPVVESRARAGRPPELQTADHLKHKGGIIMRKGIATIIFIILAADEAVAIARAHARDPTPPRRGRLDGRGQTDVIAKASK